MIEFPCDFPLKIMASNKPGVAEALTAIIRRHNPEAQDPKQRLSENENYLALTVVIQAQNQKALDALYMELTQQPEVKMVL